jgi:hypothetical protein
MSKNTKITLSLTPFSGKQEDYSNWKLSVQLAFRGARLKTHLLNLTPEDFTTSSTSSKAAKYAEYLEDCDATSGNLILQLDSVSREMVRDMVHPFTVMMKLDAIFQRTTLVNQVNTLSNLMSSNAMVSMNEPGAHCDLWFKILSAAKEIINTESWSAEDLLMFCFIKSINPGYEVCIHGFFTSDKFPSFDEIKSKLISTHERWKLTPGAEINLVNQDNPNRNNSEKPKNVYCSKCKTAHFLLSGCPCKKCNRINPK